MIYKAICTATEMIPIISMVGITSVAVHHPLFFRLASNAFPDIGSVGRIAKTNHTKSRNRRPWYPRMTLKVNIHIFGLTKCTIYCKNVLVFVPVFLYTVTMLISQIKRIISSENSLTTSLHFFSWKMPKIWVGRTTLTLGTRFFLACDEELRFVGRRSTCVRPKAF